VQLYCLLTITLKLQTLCCYSNVLLLHLCCCCHCRRMAACAASLLLPAAGLQFALAGKH
jgi:hypothetical protein